ncbi:MAG: ABC transporter permease [Leptolyngbya sp. PLA1]|nr:ABC transporter permease [Leptolyngbya sp. PLA1]
MLPGAIVSCLVLLAAACTPGFFRITLVEGRAVGAVLDVLLNGAPVVIVSAGMCLVIASGAIDLSVGSVMALAGVTGATIASRLGVGGPWPLVASLICGLLCGVISGALVARLRLPAVVATLVTMVACRGGAQAITSGLNRPFPDQLSGWLANGSVGVLPVPVLISIAVVLAMWLFVRRWPLGLAVQTLGESRDAARRAGVPVRGLAVAIFGIAGVCSALAGVLVCADIQTADPNSTGLGIELDAILAVVIGGGSLRGGRAAVLGAALGALLMQTATVLLDIWGVAPGLILATKAVVAVLGAWALGCDSSSVAEGGHA